VQYKQRAAELQAALDRERQAWETQRQVLVQEVRVSQSARFYS
jgi:hypothetical protein